jgi:acetyl-CoA carboxylase biotin carboxylase subunit
LIKDEKQALEMAHKLGYPVIIKAVAGGGGRGMRTAHNDASLLQGFHSARAEAESAFANGDLYMEKFLVNPRHIEVQILADNHGNVIHLGERDCSVQRRNQKLIEETPSPAISSKIREKLGIAAVKAAKAANYTSAGTIEFLLDPANPEKFYFMEMNTRIQVEHPVSEMITGIDLVKEQIRIAAGCKLNIRQKDVQFRGHAIECRINAEDPERNFAPCPGKIEQFIPAGGPNVRMDTHAFSGYFIPPYYDSLIGKLIVWGHDRNEALSTCHRALSEVTVQGVKTTIPFQKRIIGHKNFIEGKYDTGFVESILQKSNSSARKEKSK